MTRLASAANSKASIQKIAFRLHITHLISLNLAKNSKFHKYNPIQENPSEKNINSYYEKNS